MPAIAAHAEADGLQKSKRRACEFVKGAKRAK